MEQASNKRNNHTLTIDNRTLHVAEWARESGLHVQTIIGRIRKGWPTDQLLSKQDGRKTALHERGPDGRFIP